MTLESLREWLPLLLAIAGAGQIALVLASPAIPRVLGWREETQRLSPLTRQIFWTWAAYVWLTHLCFGLISILGSHWLLDASPLAAAVTAFIAAWWTARLVLQFALLDRSAAPATPAVRVAEVALVGLFIYLAAVYISSTVFNLWAGGASGG